MKEGIRNYLLGLGIAGLTAGGCNQPVKGRNGVAYDNALAYNNYIIDRQHLLMQQVDSIVKESKVDLSKAESTLDSAVTLANRYLAELQEMPEWKGNTAFRDHAVNLFRFYKAALSEPYRRIIGMQKDGQLSAAEETEYRQLLGQIAWNQRRLDEQLKKAQTAFARSNGFRVQGEADTSHP